jgi:hypothetical protein
MRDNNIDFVVDLSVGSVVTNQIDHVQQKSDWPVLLLRLAKVNTLVFRLVVHNKVTKINA